MDYTPLLAAASQRYGVPLSLAQNVMQAESGGNSSAVSPAGAQGLMQLMPGTAQDMGVTNPNDPAQNINGGVHYLAQMLHQFGDPATALAAYNWGPGNVAKYGPQAAPAETKSYVKKVLGNMTANQTQSAPSALPQNLQWLSQPLPQGEQAQQPSQQAASPALPDNLQWLNQPIKDGTTATHSQSQPGMLASFGAGVMHGLGQVATGTGQLIGHMIEAQNPDFDAAIASHVAGGQPVNPQGEAAPWLLDKSQQMSDGLDKQYAPYDAAHPIVSGIGNIGGQIAGTLPTMMLGPEYAGLSLAGKVGLGAVQGAAGSAMLPVSNPDGNYWAQKGQQMAIGGGLGAATPAAIAGANSLGRGIWNAVKPVLQPERYVGEGITGMMSPQEAAEAAANIRNTPTYTPGYQPTTAQVSGSPLLVQTEKASGNLPAVKNALVQRGINNNQALWDSLNSVAGTPQDLQNAIANRDAVTTPLYNVAKQQMLPVDAPMSDLLSRPAMQSAIKRAQTLADNKTAGPIFSTSNIPNAMGGSPTTVTNLTGNGAQAIKEGLDAMLLPENTTRLSGKEIGAIQDTRNAYMAWLESHSPEFTQARQTYAAMSPPINSMQAAQQIQNRLSGLGKSMDVANNPIITAPSYATALGRALSNQEFGIEPQAQTALENIGHDLQRGTISNSIRSPGSDTAYNLAANGWLAKQLYGPAFGGATATGRGILGLGLAAAGHPWAGATVAASLGQIGKQVGARAEGSLAGLLSNPDAILPYLDARAASASQPVQNAFAQRLFQYGRPALVNGTSGLLVNGPNK